MKHRHLIAKVGCHQPQQLGGQGDFRHQQQRAFPLFQAFPDQPDVHAGFPGAGDAVQQRHTGMFSLHPLPQSLKAAFLLLVQHQGPLQGGGDDLPAAQNRPVGEVYITLFLQPPHHGGGGPRKIAQLLDADLAQIAQHFQHGALFGRSLGILPGLLSGGGEGGDLLGFVPAPAEILRLSGDPFLPREIPEGILQGFPRQSQGLQLRLLGPAAQLLHQAQNLGSAGFADGFFLPLPVFGEGIHRLGVKPQSRGQDGPAGVVKGAEIPLPEESRQPQLQG